MSLGIILRQKSLRDEGVWIWIDAWIPVQETRPHDAICAGGNQFVLNDNILSDGSCDDGDTLIQSETLLETHLEVLHVGEVPGGGGPLPVLPEDVPQLLLAFLLDLGVTRHQVQREGHVGRRGVVT